MKVRCKTNISEESAFSDYIIYENITVDKKYELISIGNYYCKIIKDDKIVKLPSYHFDINKKVIRKMKLKKICLE